MNRLTTLGALATVALVWPTVVEAQLPPAPSPPLRSAYYAAAEGRFEDSFSEFLQILEVTQDSTLVAEIAVQTGELYQVAQLTDDGRGLVASVHGGLVAYTVETDDGPAMRLHRIQRDSDGWTAAEVDLIQGSRAALWSDASHSRVAYLSYGDAVAIESSRLQIERARARQSSLEFLAARRQMEWLSVTTAELRIREVETGSETVVDLGDRVPIDWTFDHEGQLLVAAAVPGESGSGLYRADDGGSLQRIDRLDGYKSRLQLVPGSNRIVVDVPAEDPAPHEPGAPPSPRNPRPGFAVLDLASGEGTVYEGSDPVVSADGSTLAYVVRPDGFEPDRIRHPHGPAGEVHVLTDGTPRLVFQTDRPLRSLALSPDGEWLAHSLMLDRDWEVFVRPTRGSQAPRRITNEIQHDLGATFVGRSALLAHKGESRHRRAYLYDFAGSPPLKLFDNNIHRTITPEYEWLVGPEGEWVVIVAERDGDTVSPERGVYLVDLTRQVTREQVRERLQANLERERELDAIGDLRFAAIDDSVSTRIEDVSVARIYGYERVLHSFGSKYITEPGNARARDYIAGALRSFGYQPTLEEFEPRPGVRSANIVARLPGTEDPSVVYVISSHYDSSIRGAGADDNTSGTSVLLETARVLAGHPQRATIEFVFLTGEEAGLLGAREYVRRAQSTGKQIVGVLNNDMVGWSNDHQLDNTIRYSSVGIRDVQHAAARRHSRLITYDAKYYKSTDAHAFYDAYGDIVGGIGSYPVLGNPNYHQATDRLETINHELVAEVAKTTTATIMALAHGPSRPAGMVVQRMTDGGLRVTWTAAERAVRSYRVRYRSGPSEAWSELTTTAPAVELPALQDGAQIEVESISREGLPSWDAARATLGDPDGPSNER